MTNTTRVIISLMLLLSCTVTFATIHDVQINGITFSPANIQIEAGDTVRWTNDGGFHNIEANDGSFKCSDNCEVTSGDGNGNASSTWTTVEITFNYVGLFNYLCEIHFGGGMVGSVNVIAPTTGTVHEVHSGNFQFSPNDLAIEVGDFINFINDEGVHNVRADDDSFKCSQGCLGSGFNLSSSASISNWNFYLPFNEVSENRYYCEPHGGPGGSGMAGIIRVQLPDNIFANGFE